MPGSDDEAGRLRDDSTAHSIEVPAAAELDENGELERGDAEPETVATAAPDEPSAPILPPTILRPIAPAPNAFHEGPTDIRGLSNPDEERQPEQDAPAAGTAPAPPRLDDAGTLPPPAAEPPAVRTAPSAGRSPARLAKLGVLAVLMLAGALVVGHHALTMDDRPASGPLLPVEQETAAVAHEARELEPDPEDAERPIPELERAAVEHLSAGRLEAAGRVYVTLARRVPHEPAYAVAARVLAERSRP